VIPLNRPFFSPIGSQISDRIKFFAAIATFSICLHTSALAAWGESVCDPRAYGAKADGKTKDTQAIQSAINHCAQKGGGVVKLNRGTYLSGPIELESGITLEIDKGSTLLGSLDHSDYLPKTEFRKPGLQSLVSATNAIHVAILGGRGGADTGGVIDGSGESWWEIARSHKDSGVMGVGLPRPRLVVFNHCTHVRVEGVTLQNSPFWQLVPYDSNDVVIRNVKVLAPPDSPNTDAVDPFSSSNIVIDHLYADVGDDDVAIKSGAADSPGGDPPSRNISIRDSTFLHGHGLSIGSEIAGGAQNIVAERIHFNGTSNGIRVKANRDRGNDVSHLTFRDIDMQGVKNAIIVSEYYPKILPEGKITAAPVTRLTPHFHDITIENLTATGIDSAGAIVGLPESPVLGVVLNSVSVQAATGLTIGYAEVKGQKVQIHPQSGKAITSLEGAKIALNENRP
jgi:polygalacturonase